MAFTDFKSPAEVQTAYQITACEEHFIDIMPKAPSERFLENFKFTTAYFDVFSSEASRCENVIYPLLLEASRHIVSGYSLWSHKSIVADATLSGTPDYIIASRSKLGKNVFGLPLVLVVEAKQNDFTKGWGECLAELVAAQKLNEQPDYPVYGIVTDGELWQFGKLHETQFTQEVTRSTIDDIEKVFGSIYAVIQLVIKGASSCKFK